MDINDITEILNQIYGVADSIDDTPAAVKRLTNGNQTTREVLKLDLLRFLMYVCSADGITDNDATLMGLVMDNFGYTANDFISLSRTVADPDPDQTISLMSFCLADIMFNKQKGTRGTQFSDVCINTFDVFGNIAVAMHNDNRLVSLRKETLITGMRLYAQNAVFN